MIPKPLEDKANRTGTPLTLGESTPDENLSLDRRLFRREVPKAVSRADLRIRAGVAESPKQRRQPENQTAGATAQ